MPNCEDCPYESVAMSPPFKKPCAKPKTINDRSLELIKDILDDSTLKALSRLMNVEHHKVIRERIAIYGK